MHILRRFWLRCALLWHKGQSAEALHLRLLNDALHREGKLRGASAPYTPLPAWRAQALRGVWAESPPFCKLENSTSVRPLEECNHVLFLTVPDSMFRLRAMKE